MPLDDKSIFLGYQLHPHDLTYFDLERLCDEGSVLGFPCPVCMNDELYISDSPETMSWDGRSMSQVFDILIPSFYLFLVCHNCGAEIPPTGIMVKDETTGQIQESLARGDEDGRYW